MSWTSIVSPKSCRRPIRSAQSKAIRYGHQQIDVEHLLAALLEQEGGLAPSILTKAGINVESLAARLEAELDRMPKVSGATGGARPGLRHRAAQPPAHRGRGRSQASSRTNTSPWSTCCWPRIDDSGAAGRMLKEFGLTPRAPDAGAARGARQPARHLARIPRPPTRRWSTTAATSPSWPRRASSIR